jgi:lipopolysaccharide/colanic/teichoic acid biosynthesis glycosyltransferase
MKRAFDIVASALALLLLLPFLAMVAVAIKLASRGPMLFRGRRVGQHGTPFTIYKFRTMRSDGAAGAAITRGNDPRVTRLGRSLRRFKIDELPQLINVLKGEMSIVGPRPEDESYVALYSAEQQKVLAVRPGLTSIASVAYSDEEELLRGEDWHDRYVNEIMPAKLRLELDYLVRRSFAGDLGIVLRTVCLFFTTEAQRTQRAL